MKAEGDTMDFEPSPRSRELQDCVRGFMETHVDYLVIGLTAGEIPKPPPVMLSTALG